MKTQDDRVEKLNKQADTVIAETKNNKLHEDVEEFNKRWKITFQKIGRFSI